MTPAEVKNIISKTKEDHTTDGQKSTDELSILGEGVEEREEGRETERRGRGKEGERDK